MSVMQISVMGIIALLLAMQMKETKGEFVVYLSLAVSLLICGFSILKISQMVRVMNEIKNEYGISSEYLGLMLKIVGISYLCEFSSDLCKDHGMQALGNQIQIFGKLTVLVTGMPVLIRLFDSITVLL